MIRHTAPTYSNPGEYRKANVLRSYRPNALQDDKIGRTGVLLLSRLSVESETIDVRRSVDIPSSLEVYTSVRYECDAYARKPETEVVGQ